jgi:RHS repeat-associated protein
MLATNKQGGTTWKAVAESFGSTGVLPGNSITMNLRFPGQYFDSETDSHYNFLRNYKPDQGRYAQSDPIGLNGGVNEYVYGNGRPTYYIDPQGLSVKWHGNMVSADLTIGAVLSAGAGGGYYSLESDCQCGYKYTIKGLYGFVEGGIGIGSNIHIKTPKALTKQGLNLNSAPSVGIADFTDEYANCPDDGAANGEYTSVGIQGTLVIYQGSYSRMTLGRLSSDWGWGNGLSVGLSVGYSEQIGYSHVISSNYEKCKNCE